MFITDYGETTGNAHLTGLAWVLLLPHLDGGRVASSRSYPRKVILREEIRMNSLKVMLSSQKQQVASAGQGRD